LSGIIATKDPSDGYAILGEQGKSARLYHSGAPLALPGGGRLYRVFVDRVVLDLNGQMETLRLPRYRLPGATAGLRPGVDDSAQSSTDAASVSPAVAEVLERQVTPAQTTFSALDAQRITINGQMEAMVLHPAKRYQRQYGFRDGDTLTAINGVAITDPDELARALKTSGKSLSLTFTRDGVPQTKTIPVEE
jgi:type II secretion system protein C